jgi:hypothetical protein
MNKMSFKKGSSNRSMRDRIAEAIHRENPGISMESKMAIATSQVKKSRSKRGRKR